MTEPLQDQVNRAQQAQRLITDPILNEAFAKLETEYVQVWKTSKTPEGRERVWLAMGVLEQVKAHLHSLVGDGQLAQAQIDALAAEQKT